jgi:PPOX class probable F420-dependent enzyme
VASRSARSGRSATALDAETRAFLETARRAQLATASAAGEPHVVPVCFAVLDARTLAFAIDDKPKAVGRALKRLRNIDENPRFALVVDRWSEDWRRLGYVLISGSAARATSAPRQAVAIRALRARYPQYRAMKLDARRHAVVVLRIERVHAWGRLAAARAIRPRAAARTTPRRSARVTGATGTRAASRPRPR